ncbi:hypothetical protein [Methanoplanus endosymbiosus]|uniref:Uncharacterized protein n=1 Tax=Methanoplanus endosymbiosus TaxID=33865 RepID=A0A9E7PKY4_9EURY|nr:hypothetical protein [Methanoplanus endosymbiosus]UUX92078.1 hypothetical protein L6E24_12045 [Methanoplanus endosymbiosus]
MQLADDLASVEFGDQKFAIHERPLDLIMGRKTIRCYLVDEAAGGSAILRRETDANGYTALDVSFNGWEIAKIVDNSVSRVAWQPDNDSRKVAIAFIVGGLLFGFLALLI